MALTSCDIRACHRLRRHVLQMDDELEALTRWEFDGQAPSPEQRLAWGGAVRWALLRAKIDEAFEGKGEMRCQS